MKSVVQLGQIGNAIQVLRTGKWQFPDYGEVTITPQDLETMVKNFRENVRGQDLPINIEHMRELGALGKIKDMYLGPKGDTLHIIPEFNAYGEEMALSKQAFMYASLEFFPEWTDEETQQSYKDVCSGLALTNYPRIKRMEQIAFTEPAVITDQDFDEAIALEMADTHYTPQKVRDGLPTSAFAFVQQRKILIHRPGNVRAGIARFMQVQGVNDHERDTAWGRLKRAATKFGVTCPKSWRDIGKKKDTAMAEVEELLKRIEQILLAEKTMPTNENPDPDHDGDDDRTAAGDTDHDYHPAPKKKAAKKKPVKKMAENEEEQDEDTDDDDADEDKPDRDTNGNGSNKMSEKVARQLAESQRQIASMQTQLAEAQRQISLERTTRELLEFNEVLDRAKREGRISPADATRYGKEAPKMNPAMRDYLKTDVLARPPVMAQQFGEIGSGAASAAEFVMSGRNEVDSVQLDTRARAIQASEKLTYREALNKAREELRKR